MIDTNTSPLTTQAFSILGEPASKSNSRRAVSIKGKMRFIKSSKALSYAAVFKQQCMCLPLFLMEGDLAIQLHIFYSTRRPDLDESLILDLLQDVTYKNDRQIKQKHVYWGLDKDNPRSDIKIWCIK
jgi:Holliday junction resolvase RusA-like endonuclease